VTSGLLPHTFGFLGFPEDGCGVALHSNYLSSASESSVRSELQQVSPWLPYSWASESATDHDILGSATSVIGLLVAKIHSDLVTRISLLACTLVPGHSIRGRCIMWSTRHLHGGRHNIFFHSNRFISACSSFLFRARLVPLSSVRTLAGVRRCMFPVLSLRLVGLRIVFVLSWAIAAVRGPVLFLLCARSVSSGSATRTRGLSSPFAPSHLFLQRLVLHSVF